jgi:hypothetical protein
LLTCRKWTRCPMKRLLCLWLGLFRHDAGADQSRVDRDRGAGGFATLTCHFFRFQLLALDVGSLAIGVIELRRAARLVFQVGFTALRQPRPMATDGVVVALAAIAGAADIKHDAAFWPSTCSPADLDVWQGGRAFPKAGLDNGRQSWQAMNRTIDGTVDWFRRLRPQPMATVGAFLFPPLQNNK